MNRNQSFRSNGVIKFWPDKSNDNTRKQRFNNSKIDADYENIYFVAPNNGIELGTSVRFHSYKINPPNNTNASFTENNDNENINNNINIQEITYRFPVKESNRNLFSRLKSSIAKIINFFQKN